MTPSLTDSYLVKESVIENHAESILQVITITSFNHTILKQLYFIMFSSILPGQQPSKSCDACFYNSIYCNGPANLTGCEICVHQGILCITNGLFQAIPAVKDNNTTTVGDGSTSNYTGRRFHSPTFLRDIEKLQNDLVNRQYNGRRTHFLINAVINNFLDVSMDVISSPELHAFLIAYFRRTIVLLQLNINHDVWRVAKYHRPTNRELNKLSALIRSIGLSAMRFEVNWLNKRIPILEMGSQMPQRRA
ncbi:hypothetical protein SBOR_8852 [Sclerotinia borealis F-4128]|uniref:Uncharacterized protein n=1 Tax=Sclerotinia borealis (strain F-4128) TaxID=1432307 RepID=W9C865_SCLBF|nr:hypothetical protein SBOR_8852 [Sclerotinia borealis F-4128]